MPPYTGYVTDRAGQNVANVDLWGSPWAQSSVKPMIVSMGVDESRGCSRDVGTMRSPSFHSASVRRSSGGVNWTKRHERCRRRDREHAPRCVARCRKHRGNTGTGSSWGLPASQVPRAKWDTPARAWRSVPPARVATRHSQYTSARWVKASPCFDCHVHGVRCVGRHKCGDGPSRHTECPRSYGYTSEQFHSFTPLGWLQVPAGRREEERERDPPGATSKRSRCGGSGDEGAPRPKVRQWLTAD